MSSLEEVVARRWRISNSFDRCILQFVVIALIASCACDDIVISDPEHPNFDLEAYLMKAAESDGR